jgi:hypothetical protein
VYYQKRSVILEALPGVALKLAKGEEVVRVREGVLTKVDFRQMSAHHRVVEDNSRQHRVAVVTSISFMLLPEVFAVSDCA